MDTNISNPSKKVRYYASGLGKMELAASPYTKEFFEAQRVFNERGKKNKPEKKETAPPRAAVIAAPKDAYLPKKAAIAVIFLASLLTLAVIAFGGLLPRIFPLFYKPAEQTAITAWDPVFGGLIKFFNADIKSEFYSDCLKYAGEAHPLTAVSFYSLPVMIILLAATSLITACRALFALIKKGARPKPPVSGIATINIFFVAAIILSGVLWSRSGAFLPFFLGESFVSAGIGLYAIIASSLIAAVSLPFSRKKIRK